MATSLEFWTEQVERLRTLIASATGVDTVVVDGQSVKYTDLLSQLEKAERKVAQLSGDRPLTFNVNMSNF